MLTPVVEDNDTFLRYVLAKAPVAMLVMLPNLKFYNYMQPLNAFSSTVVMLLGKDTSVSIVQFKNAELPIDVMLSPAISHTAKTLEFENSPFGMLLSVT